MYLNSNYISPAELTGYIREAVADYPANRFALARWLPDRMIDDLQYEFISGGQGLTDAATFRAYDAPAAISKRPGFTRVTGELPPISRKIVLGEYDRLRQRRAGNELVADGILADAVRLARQVAARIELARGDALANGSVTINEDGIEGSIDFGRDASMAVTAATTWDQTTADPIDDLTTWQQAYIDLNGEAPGAVVLSTTVLGHLQRSEAIRDMAATVVGAPAILSRQHVAQVLDAYGLPAFVVYDAQVNVAGTATRVVAENKVLLLPPAVATDDWQGTQLGATFWGTTAEALEPGYGIPEADAPGIVAGVYDVPDPVSLVTKAAAISCPILANPNLAMAATVLA